jgi:hypothetical protein
VRWQIWLAHFANEQYPVDVEMNAAFCPDKKGNVHFGSKADMTASQHDVRFTPKADIPRGEQYVRFVPKADIAHLFDHLVGNQQQVATNCQAKRLRRLQIYHQLEFSRLLYRQFGRLCPFEDFVQINGGRPGKIGQVYSI